jgi:hypothetical protein
MTQKSWVSTKNAAKDGSKKGCRQTLEPKFQMKLDI